MPTETGVTGAVGVVEVGEVEVEVGVEVPVVLVEPDAAGSVDVEVAVVLLPPPQEIKAPSVAVSSSLRAKFWRLETGDWRLETLRGLLGFCRSPPRHPPLEGTEAGIAVR